MEYRKENEMENDTENEMENRIENNTENKVRSKSRKHMVFAHLLPPTRSRSTSILAVGSAIMTSFQSAFQSINNKTPR